MLANIILKPGRVELREIITPSPSRGEILVKIKAALTCGTDLKAFKRRHPMIPMPGVFGHEFSGIVAEVGKGVRRFKESDEIMAVHSAPCLECRYCRKKLYNLCEKIMDTKVLGAFAEYILLPSHIVRQNVFHKPKSLSFEEAAFLEPLSCVVHSMESHDIKKGDCTLIIGAGPIGLLHLLLLKEKGATAAIMDKHIEKLEIAKDLGADLIFKPEVEETKIKYSYLKEIQSSIKISNPPTSPFRKGGHPIPLFIKEGTGEITKNINSIGCENLQLKKFTNNIGFDYIFECTGRPKVWESSVNYVRRGGTVILFGGCKSGTTVTYDTGRLHYDEITLKGTFHYTPSDVKKAYNLLSQGKINVSRLISGIYPLRQTQKAFDKLSKGIGIKYAIIP